MAVLLGMAGAMGFPMWIVFIRLVLDYLTTKEIFKGPKNGE